MEKNIGVAVCNFKVGTKKGKRKVYLRGKEYEFANKQGFDILIKSGRIRVPAKKSK